MGRCEYCEKTQIKSNGLSFHRFPEDEKVKLKWVENMGRTSWMLAKYSSLCSSHFDKNCIDFRDSRFRLRKGSVPTIFEHNKRNNHFIRNTVVNTDPGPQTFDQHPHIKENRINLNAVNHDHVYDNPPDIVKQKLGVARMKIKKLTNENDVLRRKAKRARKTINSLIELLSQLRDLKQLCDNENNAKRIHLK